MSTSAFSVREDGSVVVYQSTEDVLDYGLDHAELLRGGDAILSSTWAATGDVTLTSPAVVGSIVMVFIEGTSGTVQNRIATAAGRARVTTFCVAPVELPGCG